MQQTTLQWPYVAALSPPLLADPTSPMDDGQSAINPQGGFNRDSAAVPQLEESQALCQLGSVIKRANQQQLHMTVSKHRLQQYIHCSSDVLNHVPVE